MDALSLQEATGTYNGFILMAMVMSILRWVPVVLTLYSVAHAFLLVDSGSAVATRHFTRIGAGIVVIMLFFPGPFGIGVTVSPAEFAAIRVDVDNRTRASDAPENTIRDGAVITGIGTKAVVTGIGQIWVNLGLAITAQIRDSDSDAMALQRLFHAPLSASTLGVIRDWADRCVVPAKHRALAGGGGVLTAGDLQPFGSGDIASAMGSILVRPGRLNGAVSATFPFLYSQITCADYRGQLQSRVQSELAARSDAEGRPLAALWSDRLGLSVAQAAEVVVFREIERVLGPAVPAHSLRTVFQVTSAIGGVASNPVSVLSAFTAGTAVTGGLGGFGTAGVVAGAAQLSALADRLLSVLGPALVITEFSTYLFGLLQTVLLGLFGVVLCFILLPGTQSVLGPVMSYFGLLAVTYSGPLWWALIELAVATNSNPDLSIFTSPLAWGRQYLVALAIRTLGIGIVAIGISIAMGLATRSAGASVIRSLRGL